MRPISIRLTPSELLLCKIPLAVSQAEMVTHVVQKPGIGVRSPLDG